MATDEQATVWIDYTNYRGERSVRKIRPYSIMFTVSEWHPEQQWLLRAYDYEKLAMREFAVKDIHSWAPSLTPPPALSGEEEEKR